MTHDDVGLAARAAALELLAGALSRRAGLEEALARPGFRALPPRERAFARALVMATLRRLGPIDRALDARLQRPPPEAVRNLLRLGAAQAFFLETPQFAAVATSVDLAAARPQTRKFKGLVNAVLRGLIREGALPDEPQALAPEWLFARWRAAYGEVEAAAIAAVIAEEPATDLSLRDPAEADALAEALEGEVLAGGTVRTARRGDLTGWPGFETGGWWVQDASAAVPARLLGVRSGETAVELCAAPGGKTLQLAAAGAAVTAVDRSPGRLQRVADNLARTGLQAELVTANAAAWDDPRRFDAVLLDAPCAATGTFRRHPDVLWAARPGDVASLAAVQAHLMDAAAARLAPNGRLVFCVCSLEPEEGEAQVGPFLARHRGLALDPVSAEEAAQAGAPAASLLPDGTLRILPHHRPGGTDGFFVARFRRS